MLKRSGRRDYGDLAVSVPLIYEWAGQHGLGGEVPRNLGFEKCFVSGADFDKRRVLFARIHANPGGDRVVAFLESRVGELDVWHEPIVPTGKRHVVELMISAVKDMAFMREQAKPADAEPVQGQKRRPRLRRASRAALCSATT